MNEEIRGKRRRRPEPEDLIQPIPVVNARGSPINEDHTSSLDSQGSMLLLAPLGQIDEYDADERNDNMLPPKRIKRSEETSSGAQQQPLTTTTATTSQEASLTPPALPKSPFVFFFRLERETMLEKAKQEGAQFPTVQEVADVVEKKWEALRIEDRTIYDQLAANDSSRYKQEIVEYQRKQQQKFHQEHQQRLSSQGGEGIGVYPSNRAMPLPPPSVPPAATLQPANRPFPLPMVATEAATNGATITASGMAPPSPYQWQASKHRMMQQQHIHHLLRPGSVVDTNHSAIFPTRQTMTPPNHQRGISGQTPPQPLPLHVQHAPTSPPPMTAPTPNTTPTQSIPLPPGMEIELSGRKYRVGYQYQMMSQQDAQNYALPYQKAAKDVSREQQSPSSPLSTSPPR